MGRRYDTISFLSDYGHVDEFVGVVHSVIRTLAPRYSRDRVASVTPPEFLGLLRDLLNSPRYSIPVHRTHAVERF